MVAGALRSTQRQETSFIRFQQYLTRHARFGVSSNRRCSRGPANRRYPVVYFIHGYVATVKQPKPAAVVDVLDALKRSLETKAAPKAAALKPHLKKTTKGRHKAACPGMTPRWVSMDDVHNRANREE